MQFNPFDKAISEKQYFEGNDFKEAMKRLEHLKNIKGIGLITGTPGCGKTYTLRTFIYSLNPNLYKVIYLPMTTISTGEFYRDLARGLGLEAAHRKIDNFRNIQERIRTMYQEQKVTLLTIIDEAQYLNRGILADLKLLMNFEMDSRHYAILLLAGQPVLNNMLSMQIHEALKQRIIINYNYRGMDTEEVKEYIRNRMKLSGVSQPIFEENALEAAHGCCGGSVRKLNSLAHKALMIGCEEKAASITTEIIMDAQTEIELL
jgi:type II secretory pathway predicted ATPase ExeA